MLDVEIMSLLQRIARKTDCHRLFVGSTTAKWLRNCDRFARGLILHCANAPVASMLAHTMHRGVLTHHSRRGLDDGEEPLQEEEIQARAITQKVLDELHKKDLVARLPCRSETMTLLGIPEARKEDPESEDED